jgi:hypothetical protein
MIDISSEVDRVSAVVEPVVQLSRCGIQTVAVRNANGKPLWVGSRCGCLRRLAHKASS